LIDIPRYDHDTCKALCNQLADLIKEEVRRDIRDIERYKLISWVSIGQVINTEPLKEKILEFLSTLGIALNRNYFRVKLE
jgi:hypothetical protein